ncbi:44230_t:CDS:2 [Gigaspora margarita]|uniref:44230_t:CDS:1 n=1 Tax=Gigaspora margarita TaxID=4874 RepID=A0ABN7UN70_GIGMA|nr:44230_t:CDS:2 [Gigaspora margarita]
MSEPYTETEKNLLQYTSVFSSDKCIKYYCNIKLWITVKSYPIGEIVKSYWSTPNKEYMVLAEGSAVFNNQCYYTNNWPIEETIPASEEWPESIT